MTKIYSILGLKISTIQYWKKTLTYIGWRMKSKLKAPRGNWLCYSWIPQIWNPMVKKSNLPRLIPVSSILKGLQYGFSCSSAGAQFSMKCTWNPLPDQSGLLLKLRVQITMGTEGFVGTMFSKHVRTNTSSNNMWITALHTLIRKQVVPSTLTRYAFILMQQKM